MSGESAAQRAWVLALAGALVLLGLACGLQKIRSFDYWWLLRTGALIAETGAVPKVDVFTYTVNGERYVDIHWLHQLVLHGVHSLGGHAAVVIAKAVLVVGLLAILAPIGWRRERPWVTALALGLMLLVAADRFMPRPELPSFLLLAGVLALLDRHQRRGDAWVFGIVAIQLVWANVHGLFAVGIAVCAMAFAAEVARPLISPDQSLRPGALARLGAVTGLACGVSLVNPNFLEGALYPIQQLGMVGPPESRGLFGRFINELSPTLGGARGLEPLGLVLAGALAAGSFAAMALNWRRLEPLDVLLWVAFGYLALGATRNLALFAVVAAPILVRNANELLDARPARPRLSRLAGAATCLALLVASADVAAGRYYERRGSFREAGLGVMEYVHPVGAVDWLAREEPEGRLCHHMADGGYLIWRLHPRKLVMLDGRLEIYGEDRFADLQVFGPDRFRSLHEQYGFGAVLVHYSLVPSDALLWWLHLSPSWRLVFLDDVAALYAATEQAETRGWPEVDLDAPDLFPTGAVATGTEDRMRRSARTAFYMALRRWEPALALWEETLALYPEAPEGELVHATLLQRQGRGEEAEAILRRLLAESPDDAALLTRVGDLLLPDDPAAARELFDRALGLEPDLAYAAFRRGVVAELEGDAELAVLHYGRVVGTSHPAEPIAVQALERLRSLGAL